MIKISRACNTNIYYKFFVYKFIKISRVIVICDNVNYKKMYYRSN